MKIQQVELLDSGIIQIKYMRDSVEDYMVDGEFNPDLPKNHRAMIRLDDQTDEQKDAVSALMGLLSND